MQRNRIDVDISSVIIQITLRTSSDWLSVLAAALAFSAFSRSSSMTLLRMSSMSLPSNGSVCVRGSDVLIWKSNN